LTGSIESGRIVLSWRDAGSIPAHRNRLAASALGAIESGEIVDVMVNVAPMPVWRNW
jgi:hypothetical protein